MRSTLFAFQVERKRHIGNDIVTIVFQEGEESSPSFKPSMIRSHFTHIFALVRYNKQNDSYRLKIFSEESVPLFGPPLPSPPVFTDHHEFRDFVLVKLINGEKATLETPTFAQKRQRTLDMLIRSLYQDLIPDLHKEMNEIQLGWITVRSFIFSFCIRMHQRYFL
ncbi:hypothetical protein scyTo_0021780 [Scyliorhinus torazame]|uniref:Rap-GAP domain-containing protein n=1 Tax=Scyliorhinus torazame TaxID=75743 RepID=A0A401Q6U9_SCYTO|nr:hypothetical protein [Scyliorhinus torazame]